MFCKMTLQIAMLCSVLSGCNGIVVAYGNQNLGQRMCVPITLELKNVIKQHSGDSKQVKELKDFMVRMVQLDENDRPKAVEVANKIKSLFGKIPVGLVITGASCHYSTL